MAAVNFAGKHVEAPFVVMPTAYRGEHFILCDEGHQCHEELEELKHKLRAARAARCEVQRYSAAEVAQFLEAATEYV